MKRAFLLAIILLYPLWLASAQSISISSGLRLVECPPNGIPEQEACGEDINGGCDMEPGTEYFEPIECGTTICGTGFANDGTRDTDWYRLTLTESTLLTVSGEAEFPFELAIIIPGDSDPCIGFIIAAIEQVNEGQVLNIQASVGPGEVWIRAGDSGLDGNLCGDDDDDYYITVDCQPCEDFITIEIMSDDYPGETTWELIERESGTVVASAGPLSDPATLYTWQVCADPTLCYDWYIYDSFGDGLWCDWGDCGYYNVYGFDGELLCTYDEFTYVDVCPDIGNCVPQTGACCIELFCIGDIEEEPCLEQGGTWYEGETCDDFTCPEPPIGCGEAVYHNGEPTAYGAYASQCDPVYPFQFAAADDFVLPGEDETRVISIIGWTAHWNYPGEEPTPTDYEGVSVTIYNHDEANARPGGNPIDGDPDCAVEGDYAYHRIYGPGEFDFFPDIDAGVWRLEFPVEDLYLQPGVTYWLVYEVIIQFGVWGQVGPVPVEGVTGSLPMLYPAIGWGWGFPWTTDFGFCINGIPFSPCDYIPGDCDHNGVPLELGDVIAMIGMYRGTVVPPYECVCPQHGDNFTPTADPNGNCVANELGDVVTEIAAYRGSDTVSGCPDCPGLRRLLPGDEDQLKNIKTGFPK